MGGQPGSQLERVGLLTLHAQRQGAQPAQRQVGLERAGDPAGDVAAGPQLGAERGVAGDEHAHQQVGMAGQVLGGRVHDDVRALSRAAATASGVVNVASTHDQRAGLVGRRGQDRHVDHAEQRIGRRLEPQQARRPASAASTASVSVMSTGRTCIRPRLAWSANSEIVPA